MYSGRGFWGPNFYLFVKKFSFLQKISKPLSREISELTFTMTVNFSKNALHSPWNLNNFLPSFILFYESVPWDWMKRRNMKSYKDQCSRKMKKERDGRKTWGLRALLQATLKKLYSTKCLRFLLSFCLYDLVCIFKRAKFYFYFMIGNKVLDEACDFYIYGNYSEEGMIRRMSAFIDVHK